jgi:hypothetical protein
MVRTLRNTRLTFRQTLFRVALQLAETTTHVNVSLTTLQTKCRLNDSPKLRVKLEMALLPMIIQFSATPLKVVPE